MMSVIILLTLYIVDWTMLITLVYAVGIEFLFSNTVNYVEYESTTDNDEQCK